jgi:hypothetical protein
MKPKPLETFLIFTTVFVSSITFFTVPFEGYFHYLIFLLFFPFFIARYGFPKPPLQILAIPLFFGLFHIFVGDNTVELFLKIFVGLLLSTTFYFYVFEYYHMDVDELFRIYIRGCVLVSWIGLVQLISFKIGFKFGYNYGWLFNKWSVVSNNASGMRVNSIFPEPVQFAVVIIPSVFVSFNNLFTKNYKYLSRLESILIIVIVLFTRSSTGYIGIFVICILFIINYGHFVNLLIGIGAIATISTVIYTYVPEFRERVDSSMGLWINEDLSVKNVNSSSFVLYNNFHIASMSLKNNPIGGAGLGSHKVSFERYSLTRNKGVLNFAFNKSDANSLFLRLMSETGLIGVVFIIMLLYKCYIRRKPGEEEWSSWMISNSILVMLILCLVRQGNYFLNGLPFFFWLYYYNYMVYIEKHESDTLVVTQTAIEEA